MRGVHRHRFRFRLGLFLVGGCGAVAATFVGCSGPGNTGRREIAEELAIDVPWVKGRMPVISEDGKVVAPDLPEYPPIARGEVDPGSREIDCRVQEGLVFSKAWFETFEPSGTTIADWGTAQAWSSFDDATDGSFRMPVEKNWFGGLTGRTDGTWGLPAQKVAGAPACDGKRNDWVLHWRGGPFLRFGAGLSHPLLEPLPCPMSDLPEDEGLCWNMGEPYPEGIPSDIAYPPGQTQLHAAWDVSAYDGVAFWARRGPESQGTFQFILHDKYTSDDMNRQNETFCRRSKPCRTQCVNRAPCSEVLNGMAVQRRCWDPELGDFPSETTSGVRFLAAANMAAQTALADELFPLCGADACLGAQDFPDPDFDGKACQPYTFQAHETGEYCFDEDDPPPPDSVDRCADGHSGFFITNTNWQFYKIRFSDMRQSGFGKPAPSFDLTSVTSIAIVSTKGWVDLYLDNITFYKEAD